MDTKQCPYCKEEIKAEALKCKHCGEFLEEVKVSTISSPVEEPSVEIDYFNYGIGIYFSVAVVLLDVISVFSNKFLGDLVEKSIKIKLIELVADVVVWFYLLRYVRAYNKRGLVSLIWVIIVFSAAFSLFDMFGKSDVFDEDIIGIIALVLFGLYLLIYFITGVKFQRIKNDQIGLLRELGLAMCVLIPIGLTLGIAGEAIDSQPVKLIGTLLLNIPYIIMAILFMRLKRHFD